jgi:hypothetical protein
VAQETGCPICDEVFCQIVSQDGGKTVFDCASCGKFAVSASAMPALSRVAELSAVKRAAMCHRLRLATDQGQQPLLTTYELDDLIAGAQLPTPALQAINLVRFVGDRISGSGKPLREFPQDIHAIVGSPNRDFALRIVRQLMNGGLVDAIPCGDMNSSDEVMEVDLTLAGWNQYEQERRGLVAGGYGFIAMKFNDSVLDPFARDVIKPAISGVGFELIDMRDAAEAGIIDNVMRARIRDASFVLVDLTHANEGAYWEAGYAEGLGKPVLYLCNRQVFEERGTHFDTNHCTTVLWDPAAADSFTEELQATLRRSLGLFSS